MLDDNPIKKLTLLKPDGCRRVGRPKLRGMDDLSVRRWRRRALDRREWKNVLEMARAYTGL
jgi:hypothetical protein